MLDVTTRTFFCGDLFTQGGSGRGGAHRVGHPRPERGVPSADGLLRARAPDGAILERLAREHPTTLACMHGSAWRGDGARLLRELSAALENQHAAI